MEEIWKDIAGYEGYYQVSNLGRVRSLDRYIPNSGCYKHGMQYIKGKILKPHDIGKGYLAVGLMKYHKNQCAKIHRLVAEAFIDNPENFPCVNHKDENPSNNNVDNLEWCSYKYNTNYGTCVERRTPKIWKSIAQYDNCLNLIKNWESITAASRSTGIDGSSISAVARGKRKSAGGFVWRYS